MSMYSKRTTMWVKIESTNGSDPTPTAAANAVCANDVELTVKPDMKQRFCATGDRSLPQVIRGKTAVDLKFSIPLQGSGAAATAPRWAPLLQACDRALTTGVGASSQIFLPAATIQTCTIYVNMDGIQHIVTGCAGDCEIDLSAGDFGKLNFTMSGMYALATDIPVVAPTYDTTIPRVVKGTTMTFGGYACIIEKLNLKFGNTVAERTDFNATEAIRSFIVTDRAPEGTMTIEAILRATASADLWSYFDAGTTKALSFVLGATAGNIVTITAPVCVLKGVNYGDRDGIRTFEAPFQLARNTGNDEMTITLT